MMPAVRGWVESVPSELRAGWADAVRVFPGRPAAPIRTAVRIGTTPYVAGYVAGRLSRHRRPAW